MADSLIKVFRDGAVLHLVLSRPAKRNALDAAMTAELAAEAERAGRDPSARVVVLEGEGPVFCAGADLEWMRQQGDAGEEENRASAARLARLYHILDELPKPLLGRLQGACIGGGVGLAAVCDVAIADAGCQFALSEVRLGIVPAVISPFLVHRLGAARCRDLMLTGRRFGAAEALALGLVHRVAGPEEIDKLTGTAIEELLAGGPEAQVRIKRILRELEAGKRSGQDLIDWTAAEIAAARASAEGRAGLKALLERRPPPWAPNKT